MKVSVVIVSVRLLLLINIIYYQSLIYLFIYCKNAIQPYKMQVFLQINYLSGLLLSGSARGGGSEISVYPLFPFNITIYPKIIIIVQCVILDNS